MSILRLFGLILGSGLFFPVSCFTALLAGIEMNSFLFARDMSRGDNPQSPFYVLATVPTGNISPIELFEVDTYFEKTPDVSFLLAQPSGALPEEKSSWLKGVRWRVISSDSNEQLVEVKYLWGDTSFRNRYRAMRDSVSPVSSRMWFRGYMFFCFPWAIGFGVLVYWLGRTLRQKYVVRKSEKVNKCVTTLFIICILGMVAAPQYLAYRKSLTMRDQVILDLNKALEINPKDAEAYFKRGNAFAEKGLYEHAISNYTRALEISPRDASAYYNRGNAYTKKRRYDEAISDYTKTLEIDPRDADAYGNRGIAYARRGQYDQAISDYIRVLEINPRDASAYYNRGLVYGKRGQYDEAISDYTKVLEINPRDADAYVNRGNAHAEKGQYDRAISDYTKAIEIEPDDPCIYRLYYRRAYVYYLQKDYEKSWKDAEKAQYLGCAIDPKFLDDLRKASGRKN